SPETGTGVNASYGINGWSYSLNGSDSNIDTIMGAEGISTSMKGAYFYDVQMAGREGAIPLMADCNWRHFFPNYNSTPTITSLEDPGPADLDNHPINRVVLNRHNMAVNVSFLDGHADTVKLKDLFTLSWSANWVTTSIPTLPAK